MCGILFEIINKVQSSLILQFDRNVLNNQWFHFLIPNLLNRVNVLIKLFWLRVFVMPTCNKETKWAIDTASKRVLVLIYTFHWLVVYETYLLSVESEWSVKVCKKLEFFWLLHLNSVPFDIYDSIETATELSCNETFIISYNYWFFLLFLCILV